MGLRPVQESLRRSHTWARRGGFRGERRGLFREVGEGGGVRWLCGNFTVWYKWGSCALCGSVLEQASSSQEVFHLLPDLHWLLIVDLYRSLRDMHMT
jgi:hypothetical protein